MEDNISEVFNLLHRYKMKVELIQKFKPSAFSLCWTINTTMEPLLAQKQLERFKVVCYYGVTLYTIRQSKPVEINRSPKTKVLLKQESLVKPCN